MEHWSGRDPKSLTVEKKGSKGGILSNYSVHSSEILRISFWLFYKDCSKILETWNLFIRSYKELYNKGFEGLSSSCINKMCVFFVFFPLLQ